MNLSKLHDQSNRLHDLIRNECLNECVGQLLDMICTIRELQTEAQRKQEQENSAFVLRRMEEIRKEQCHEL